MQHLLTQHLLAQAESIPTAAIFQALFSAVVSLSLWKLTAWQRRYEGLERRLNEATGRLIDERIRAVSTELENHTRATRASLDETRQRLAAGERAMVAMAEADHRFELTLTARLDGMKDYVREFAPARTDLERHEQSVERRLTRVETRLEELTG
ncbi:hypothetical protein [Humisphaera borealis]|uniref:Uncharacterized protein n=1 Tax=Humisphaera borealis TaxID=2807512 RepID=A0A7M2X4E7_9BACT|nr:hypothetical protein [Humisphaera borealis]QOV91640.1 hypothetical protein IPV69_09860 [Humisphaera borealis]